MGGFEDKVRGVLSDTINLPDDFLSMIPQYVAQNPIAVGAQRAPMLIPTGTPGATAASRFVGATTGGAPTTGTFQTGDVVVDLTGGLQVCTSGGTPGTWSLVGWYGRQIGYDQATTPVTITGTTIGGANTIVAGSSHVFDGLAVMAEFFAPEVITPTVAGQPIVFSLFESGTSISDIAYVASPAAAALKTPVFASLQFTPTAGSHTYSIKAYATNVTGPPSVQMGAAGSDLPSPAYLRFTKV